MKIEQRYLPALRAILRRLRHDEDVALQVVNDAVAGGKDGTGIGSYLQGLQAQIEALEYVINYWAEQGRIHVSPVTASITIVAFIALVASVIYLFLAAGGG